MAKQNAAKLAKVSSISNPAKVVKRGRKPADPNETPARRFIRLGSIRTKVALTGIKTLENLTPKVSEDKKDAKQPMGYYHTPEQWEKIVNAIEKQLNRLKKAIANGKPNSGEGFSL